jgi:hypothetical protein
VALRVGDHPQWGCHSCHGHRLQKGCVHMDVLAPIICPFPKDNCPAHPRFSMTNSVSPMCLSIFARYMAPVHSFFDPSPSHHSQS